MTRSTPLLTESRAVVRPLAVVPMLASATVAQAHERMYIDSVPSGSGSLVLRYDFARKFPLDPLPRPLSHRAPRMDVCREFGFGPSPS